MRECGLSNVHPYFQKVLDDSGATLHAETEAAGRGEVAIKAAVVALVFLSIGFFSSVTSISLFDPGYFDRQLISAVDDGVDPIQTGSTEKAPPDGMAAIPVPQFTHTPELKPADFQIVMIYGNEAHLATLDALWYVRVGSKLPGLGTILSIEPDADGGTVKAEHATLRGVIKRR